MIRSGISSLSDLPMIFWRNVVTADIVSAESDPDFPDTNVANPSTALKWKHDAVDSPESAIEYFRIDVSAADTINYVAIAGHNFSSGGVAVGLQVATGPGSPIPDGETLFEPQIPDDDSPLIFVFADLNIEDIRIVLVTGTSPAEMAVVYAGEYTVLEEGIQETHVPLPLAAVNEVLAGKSQNGAFLGKIVTSSELVSPATISNLSPDWVRDELMPFLDFAAEFPFFWAWSPLTYPDETAFAWLDNDPQPSFDVDGYASVDLSMRGLT